MHGVVSVLIEVLLVIGLSRLVGLGFRWIDQPLVIGEIVAGIMLGPSLFGWLAPDLWVTLFPAETVPYLNVLSQIGLIFFMFLIGLELDPKYLKGNLNTAILTSNVSILVPFLLASVLALVLYPLISNAGVSFTAFALFLGAAMSITAFPVLARIITENNLQSTRLGTLALTCAAVDDVTAWCLLAVAIAVTRTNSMVGAIPTIVESIVYITLMLTVGRWLGRKLAHYYRRKGRLTQLLLAMIYMAVVTSALITEIIGIHLIFGAFLVGAALPKEPGLVRELAQKTEDFVLIFLLPIFFAYSGLRTEIGLLNRPELWWLCLAVLVVAIAGKYVGTYIAARASGIEKREAAALGWLMNTRGLTELIVLNIGLSLGVISPVLFTMLVIMALVTTFMTSPLLEWTYPKKLISLNVIEPEKAVETEPIYRILVPVANPKTQKKLLQVAAAIAGLDKQPAAVYPLSLVELEEDYLFESTPVEAERSIRQRRTRIEELIQTLQPPEIRSSLYPVVRITNDVARETAAISQMEQIDLILLGWHRSVMSSSRLGGRVGQILTTVPVDVAVFVDRPQHRLQSLLVPYSGSLHDDLALELALRLLMNDETRRLSVLRVTERPEEGEFSFEFRQLIDQLQPQMRDRIDIQVVAAADPLQVAIEASKTADLTLAGTSSAWGIERQTLGRYTDELAMHCHCSLLITRRYSRITSHLSSVLAAQNQPSTVNP